MDIDIPLPGEEPSFGDIEPPDIPMPDDPPEPPRRMMSPEKAESDTSEPSQDLDNSTCDPPLPPMPPPTSSEDESDDPNRYSPSVPMEDDDPIIEIPTVIPPLLPPPPPPPSLAPLPPMAAPRSPSPSPEPSPPPVVPQSRSVLGKTQAKKRLLAFSMTKQGGGAGVSFNLAKKQTINKDSAKGFSEENKDEAKKKPAKKGSVDKARDTISEIEELKRKEIQLLENMQAVHPRWGLLDTHNLPAALPLQLAGNLDSTRSVDIFDLVGEVLAKKSKREAEREKERARSPTDERRRKSKRSDKDKERSRRKVLPKNWKEFKKDGHKIYYFRRFKYDVEKGSLREKKRHKRSRTRSRSRERSKKDKSPSKSGGRINLLETPMVVKKVGLPSRKEKKLKVSACGSRH